MVCHVVCYACVVRGSVMVMVWVNSAGIIWRVNTERIMQRNFEGQSQVTRRIELTFPVAQCF